jgi:hypothetical protein
VEYTINLNLCSTRSGGVSVTGASGGYATIGSGAEVDRVWDGGQDCINCPKGGSIKFKAIDGNPWGNGAWGAKDVNVFGCTKVPRWRQPDQH